MTAVLAAHKWPSNAELILDVARLGYINETDKVLDPTFGRGIWWQKFRPHDLTTHDIALDGVDFRNLPYEANTFDVVAYDPPYVSVGGRATSTIPDFQDRYGMTNAPKSPAELQQLINDGLTEMHRVVKERGFILTKCQDYVSSGQVWTGTYYTQKHAREVLGLIEFDSLEHIGNPRPQPARRRQMHARRNLSTLFVFQKKRGS